MWTDLGLFSIIFSSLIIGWMLAKFTSSSSFKKFQRKAWRKSYMDGIHLLLNEESDKVVENLIQTWGVSNDNFDLHNALANMLRRKGEVDRAIRIHSNLVESQKIGKEQLRSATTELACDYIKAGLLDRAERLLINVVNTSKDFEERALKLLQQIYELEREWQKAILIAQQLIPVQTVAFSNKILSAGKQRIKIANYYCELATEALAEDNFKCAEESLQQALYFQPDYSRALIIQAQLFHSRGDQTLALSKLKQLADTDPTLVADVLPLIDQVVVDNPKKIDFLMGILADYPSSQIDEKVFDLLKEDSKSKAMEFLAEQVRRRPTLRGLDLLLKEQQGFNLNIDLKIRLFHELVIDVLKNKPLYQCKSCGFSGRQMHWQCPQCHNWDSIRLIRGGEGD